MKQRWKLYGRFELEGKWTEWHTLPFLERTRKDVLSKTDPWKAQRLGIQFKVVRVFVDKSSNFL